MEKPKPSLRESADQVMGNNQKRIGETSQLDNGKDAKINRYAENTSGNSAEINAEIYSHNGQGEAEVEKEKRLLLLIKGCSRVMPEEDPAGVGEVITRAMDTFSMEWVRQAINEAALRNKRSLQGILEILQMWEKSTPSKRPLKP